MIKNVTGNSRMENGSLPTDLKKVLTWTEKLEQYDEYAKNLLARKSLLSYILTATVEDFKGMSPKELEFLIEGDVYVQSVPAEPGRTNADFRDERKQKNQFGKGKTAPDRLREFNTEQSDQNEGTIYFDILFYVRLPDGISRIIVNIEAQRKEPSEYELLNRAIFSSARLISSQKEREFTGENFDDLCRTWSIWIKFNARKPSWNYITLSNRAMVGDYEWKGKLDLINIHLLRVPNKVPEKDDKSNQMELLRFLSIIFSTKLSSEEKIEALEKDFGMEMETNPFGKEIEGMGSLGLGIYEEGVEDGFEQGIEQGKQLGDEAKAIKVAKRMSNIGYKIPEIADALEANEEQIMKWVGVMPA